MKKKIALFDFDGTLTTKDTFIEFGLFAVGRKNLFTAMMRNAPYLIGWKLGVIPNYVAKERLFSSLYKGMSISEFNGLCEAFSNKIEDMLHPVGYEKFKMHLEEGCPIYIVSASIENWIKPWVDCQGVTDVIATRIEIDGDGRLTGRFSSKNCYGQEKVNRVKQEIKDIESYEVWGYGDSKGDEDILKIAKHPMVIK